ncbi:MAG: Protein AmpG [Myxococcota bacterium]|nr:Protein AmpG [Myxococcota bacterium]
MSAGWKAWLSPRVRVLLPLGLVSGLPLPLTSGTLQAWLVDSQIGVGEIGAITAFVGLPYSIKIFWSPLVDAAPFGFLDRRRAWMLSSLIAAALCVLALSWLRPDQALLPVVHMVLALAVFSATFDIAFDGYRAATLRGDAERGAGVGASVFSYRIGMLLSGAAALWMSESLPWSQVFWVLAGVILVFGAAGVFWAPAADDDSQRPRTIREAVVDPLRSFFGQSGAWIALPFILFYKLSDIFAGLLTTAFLLSVGFTKGDVAVVSKGVGLMASIAGGVAGGVLVSLWGLRASLWAGAVVMTLSNLGFLALTWTGADSLVLAAVVVIENLAGGVGTAAFVAYLLSLTQRQFAATQYAALTSLMVLPRLMVGNAGYLQETWGWRAYFLASVAAALPSFLLIPWAARAKPDQPSEAV